MPQFTQFFSQNGQATLFILIFLEQIGIPIPALPWLLAAGAAAATGHFNLPLGLLLSIIACLIPDAAWFFLGRHRGSQVLGLMCRISLEPDSCVRRTQDLFARYGWRGIVLSKFLPGMSTLTPPLAGMTAIAPLRFLLLDALGSFLYCGAFLVLGLLFNRQISQITAAFSRFGSNALIILAVLVALYIAYKYWRRRRLLQKLRTARISVEQLRQMLDSDDKPLVLDVRSRAELTSNPSIIAGAIHLTLDEVPSRHHEFPRDRDIVVYCSCPNEVSAARVALLFQRHGFTRIRPLKGGFQAWRDANHPLGAWSPAPAAANPLLTPAPAR